LNFTTELGNHREEIFKGLLINFNLKILKDGIRRFRIWRELQQSHKKAAFEKQGFSKAALEQQGKT